MADLLLRPCAPGDAAALAADMRPRDREEVEAALGTGDLCAHLERSIALSDPALTFTAEHRGQLACVFGVAPLSLASRSGAIWLLGTSAMNTLGRSLGLIARRYIPEALRVYPHLTNFIDARNAPSIRLVEWLGFSLRPAEPHGIAGLPFHRFELRSASLPCASLKVPRP